MRSSLIKKITQITPIIISAASLIFAAQFLYHTIRSSFEGTSTFWIPIVLVISGLVFVGLRNEFKIVRSTKLKRSDYHYSKLLKSLLVILGNTMLTYLFVLWFGTTTIFAASLICVLSAYLFPNHEPEAYSGSVAGMIGVYLSSHWSIAFLTGMITGFTYFLFMPYFKGVGGRGGSIPYVATILSVRLIFDLQPEIRVPIEEELIVPSFITLVLITFLTYLLHQYNVLSVVKAAMIVSLIFSILIPDHLYTITMAMFAGTIVAMSIEERLDNYFHLLVVAVICFILFVPSFHILDGIGGKLGMLSLLSYYSSMGLKSVVLTLKNRFSNHTQIT